MAQETDPPDPFQMLQILYKTEHSGASGASWLRRSIRQILSKCFKSFTNPLQNWAFWSLGRLMAQEAHPPDPFQMLQIFYKSLTKLSILELWAPHGSGGPSARSFLDASNSLQILYKTDHSGASGAYCLRRLIRQILFKCFQSFTKRSILEPRAPHGSGGPSARSFLNASYPSQILYKTEHSGASGASWLRRLIRQILAKGSNPLQILYKTDHSGASGALLLRSPIRQILSRCFKSFTNPLQNGAFWSLACHVQPHDHRSLSWWYKFFWPESGKLLGLFYCACLFQRAGTFILW